MQAFEHEPVAAQRDDDIRVVGDGIAIAFRQLGQRTLGRIRLRGEERNARQGWPRALLLRAISRR
jgi:hypothetical protein